MRTPFSLVALLTGCASTPVVADARPTSFVIILADDLGYGDLSCYGNDRIQTPHLDRLAAEGLRFTDFHSSGAVCSPTRAGLLTGRYQQRAGIPGVVFADPKRKQHGHGLQACETTFAERLQEKGYATACIGKWHLGYYQEFNPVRHGFDRFRGYVSGNVDYHSHIDQAGQFDWWHDEKKVHEKGYTTHLITHHALQFLDDVGDRPFCLYVAHEAPHYPFQGPADPPQRPRPTTGRVRVDIPRAYREMVREMDRGVGEIVARLRRLGRDRDTLVLFVSDNGAAKRGGSNRPLRGFKGGLFEGGQRVPAIAWWPGKIAAGRTSTATLMTIDVMPTLLDLAGLAAPQERRLDGVGFAAILRGEEELATTERTLFWSHGNRGAARRGPWKLVFARRQAAARLFHLDSDLGEQIDLADRHPDRVASMRSAWTRWLADVRATATVQPDR